MTDNNLVDLLQKDQKHKVFLLTKVPSFMVPFIERLKMKKVNFLYYDHWECKKSIKGVGNSFIGAL